MTTGDLDSTKFGKLAHFVTIVAYIHYNSLHVGAKLKSILRTAYCTRYFSVRTRVRVKERATNEVAPLLASSKFLHAGRHYVKFLETKQQRHGVRH